MSQTKPTSATTALEPGHSNLPQYELRLKVHKNRQYELELWQLPSPSTPRLKAPEYVASLKGAALRLVEARVLKRLARAKVNLGVLTAEKTKTWPIDDLIATMKTDKKAVAGRMRFILPTKLGEVALFDDVPEEQVRDVLKDAMS